MNAHIHYEIVSAATHGAAFVAAVPASAWLVRRGERDVRGFLTAYAAGLLLCFGASTMCHAAAALGVSSTLLVKLDHMAIFALIAGTYTPITGALLPVRRRRVALLVIWLAACLGIVLNAVRGPLPAWVATAFYLAMGWGGLWCYAAVRPMMTHRELTLVPMGGVLYSLGAIFHVIRAPVLWAGIFGPHELFHVFVILGAAAHYRFVWTHATSRKPAPMRKRMAAARTPRRRRLAPPIQV